MGKYTDKIMNTSNSFKKSRWGYLPEPFTLEMYRIVFMRLMQGDKPKVIMRYFLTKKRYYFLIKDMDEGLLYRWIDMFRPKVVNYLMVALGEDDIHILLANSLGMLSQILDKSGFIAVAKVEDNMVNSADDSDVKLSEFDDVVKSDYAKIKFGFLKERKQIFKKSTKGGSVNEKEK